MINRIRDIRKEKGLTLADVAERCNPPTTAQTIGRIETGMRSLSLAWMNRIGEALGIDPNMLVKSGDAPIPQVIAQLTQNGAESLSVPRDAILPTDLAGSGSDGKPLVCLLIESAIGEYRSGDQLWMRQLSPEEAPRLVNRDVLAPRPGGRFAFGRLIDRQGSRIGLLPPGQGQRQIVIDTPSWLAAAEMLVRKL